jgi:hypothetical protein
VVLGSHNPSPHPLPRGATCDEVEEMKLPAAFAKELVKQWNHHGTLLGAILAWKNPPEGTRIDFAAAMEEVGIQKNTNLKQDVRAWIPKYFRKANEALWVGKQVTAWRLMVAGTDGGHGAAHPAKEAKDDISRVMRKEKGRVGWRDLDKRSDWRTVK